MLGGKLPGWAGEQGGDSYPRRPSDMAQTFLFAQGGMGACRVVPIF